MQEKAEGPESTRNQQFRSAGQSPKTTSIDITSPNFKRILVAYDGMQLSKRALGYAAYLSQISNSEIVVINIVKASLDSNDLLPITMNMNLDRKEEQIKVAAASREGFQLSDNLRTVIKEMKGACGASGMEGVIVFEIRKGDPADEIIEFSNLMRPDLIIMGSRQIASRMGGIGSTTRKVATTSRIPLLIVQKQPRYKDEW